MSSACLRPSPERTDIIPSSSCNAALFAIGSMQGFKLPSVAFATVLAIARRSLSCRRHWPRPNARQCQRSMRPWRRTSGRNDLIFDDVLKSLEAKRSPIVLTERKDHLDYLQQRFSPFVKNLVVLRGGMSAKDRKTANTALNVADDDERLILAIGRYIGEGFDDARLDTLFLTMPIAWKGTLAQYVGRLHRQHDGKRDVLVVDYVDNTVPVLARMAAKRRAGYRALGYVIE